MMDGAIKLTGVSKSFDLLREKQTSLKSVMLSVRRRRTERILGLSEVSLSIMRGETVAVIGKNGSGKSTLLRIIAKVYRPSTGAVETRGRMSTMLALAAGFHPELTGRENIYFNGAIAGLSASEITGKIGSIIAFSELDEFVDSPVKTYSDGMLMRLGFSIAVETDPDILLIDEVLAVGDAAFQEKCYSRIETFQHSGRTIVFVTHDLEAAAKVASRAIWIDSGRVAADGETAQVIGQYLDMVTHHRSAQKEMT